MARLETSAALFALCVAVSACGPQTNRLTPNANPSLSSANQPIVERTDYVLDVNATGSGVSDVELARLDDWFSSLRLRYGDRIALDEPAGYSDPRNRKDIARVASEYGILLSDGAPITVGSVQPGSIRVIVSRSRAEVPNCPAFNETELGERHSTAPNYGCATNSNLALMIADPADLVLGQEGGITRSDGQAATKAIKTYRDKPPTGAGALKVESTGGQ